jgi:DNA-directed RNA polymerase subunit RPC12/RpoP
MPREVIDFVCPKCGHDKSYKDTTKTFTSGECLECGALTFFEFINGYTPPPLIECPYCHSKDTKKISGMSKAGSVALFGVFSIGKVTKQWHCNNCKSDF